MKYTQNSITKTSRKLENKLSIGTLNVRSLVGTGRQEKLEFALKIIKWYILGLSEVKKKDNILKNMKALSFSVHAGKAAKMAWGLW